MQNSINCFLFTLFIIYKQITLNTPAILQSRMKSVIHEKIYFLKWKCLRTFDTRFLFQYVCCDLSHPTLSHIALKQLLHKHLFKVKNLRVLRNYHSVFYIKPQILINILSFLFSFLKKKCALSLHMPMFLSSLMLIVEHMN